MKCVKYYYYLNYILIDQQLIYNYIMYVIKINIHNNYLLDDYYDWRYKTFVEPYLNY
jgi:hypothetical protein